MALTAALHGSMIRNARAKSETYVGTILLESSSVKPYGKIIGKLILRTEQEMRNIFGMRVQLQGVISIQFQTKFDSRCDTFSECGNIECGMVELMEARPTFSENQAVHWNDVINEKPAPSLPPIRPYVLQPGLHNFGFEINLTSHDVLPAPFRSPYGSLIYKVAAYIKTETAMWLQCADKSVRFPGYNNLILNEEAERPILLQKKLQKSVFSSKKFVTADFKVDRSGFLPDEDIPFFLNINNPKCMAISSIVVCLVQKINYSAKGASKATTNTLDSKEKKLERNETEIDWHGKLKIKKKQIPTFTNHPLYNVTHILQYKVQVSDYGSIKGETPVYIGTTREPVEQLQKMANLPDQGEPKVPGSIKIRRQGSSASTTSAISAMSAAPDMECSVRSPPFSPTEGGPKPVCDDQHLEKKMGEMNVSPGDDDISTSSV